MSLRLWPAAAVLLPLVASAVPLVRLPDVDPAIAARIKRVEEGIRPGDGLARDRRIGTTSLAERMAHHKVPGLSIAVINDFAVEWAKGYGVREHGRPDPVTPATLFQAGSVSKPVAAAAALRLVEQGVLGLDEDVNRYLRSWKIPPNDGWQPRVTLRQILSHSAGLTVHGFPGYPAGDPLPTLVQILEGQPPANTPPVRVTAIPGTLFRYSGGGTTVMQQLLIDVTGQPFAALLRELVLDPIGMADSTFEQPPPAGRAATAHPKNRQPLTGRWHLYPEMAAAGLWTTASDLARFAIEIQLALAGRGTWLSRESARLMASPEIANVGLGFFVEGDGRAARFGHGGWDEGFVAHLTSLREEGKGAVIMINSNQGVEIIDEIERAIVAEYGWPDKPQGVPPEPEPPLGAFGPLTGRYQLRPGLHFTVTRKGTDLYLQATGQLPARLVPESDMRFRVDGVAAEVTFIRNERNQIVALVVEQDGRDLTAPRVR